MIPPEVLGHSNVAARDQSREFFNNIDPLRTFALGSATGALHAPDANRALWEAKRSFDDRIGTGK